MMEEDSKSNDHLNEKCAVFGVYGNKIDAARLTYFGLYALQHRGQEGSGIATSNGKRIHSHKGSGLVPQVYSEKDFKNLKGHIAIGHNRYSTSGGSNSLFNQPVCVTNDIVAVAHNGNLPTVTKLKQFLTSKKISIRGYNDSGLMYLAIKYFLMKGDDLESAIAKSYPLFTGAFSLLVMTRDKLVAVRDRCGIRPLSLGKIDGGFVVASETCAIDTVSGEFLRTVQPGEMIVIDKKGVHDYQLVEPDQKLDVFEFVYFARPDSNLLGRNVYKVRENLGRELANEHPLNIDAVIPVPDSAIPAAIGYGRTLKIPIEHGLVKNRYIGRTFIMPNQSLRDRGVQMKLNPIRELIEGRKVALVDDSIVRSTTAKKIVQMVRNAGAKEVHFLVSSPPVLYPDFYGINTPSQKELVAANKSIKEIEKLIGVDSLNYLSVEGLVKATGLPASKLCMSCFTGEYPIDIGENKDSIKFAENKRPSSQSVFFSAHEIRKERKKKRLAILISNAGTGTNLQAIIDGIEKKKINAKISVVISDKEDAYGLVRAKKHKLKTHVLKKEENLTELLNEKYQTDYVVLAGWKKIIPDEFIESFKNKIVNIHPGLIPHQVDDVVKNPDGTSGLWNRGKFTDKAITNFLDSKATYAGSTVHFLSKEFDFGPVLQRCYEKVSESDTVESLYQRLKKKENEILVSALVVLCV